MIKKYFKSFILLLLAILFILLGCIFYKESNLNYKQDIVNFNENGQINYKVYLNENNFFEEDYLGPGKPYITTLIDYIDIDFSYLFNMNSMRNGRYIYYVTAVMSANISNSESNYWEKEYKIIPPTIVNYEKKDSISFDNNIKINYQEYNNLLTEFKNEYGLSIDGKLKVNIYIENYVNSNLEDAVIPSKISSMSLTIPLTKATIEVPIEVKNISTVDSLKSNIIKDNNKFYLAMKIIGIILSMLGIISIINLIIKFIKDCNNITLYDKTLNRILKTYDGIIVSVSALPNLITLDIVDVNSFEELLDAHSEIRHPINYYQGPNIAIFILVKDTVAWRYILRKESGSDINEKK